MVWTPWINDVRKNILKYKAPEFKGINNICSHSVENVNKKILAKSRKSISPNRYEGILQESVCGGEFVCVGRGWPLNYFYSLQRVNQI